MAYNRDNRRNNNNKRGRSDERAKSTLPSVYSTRLPFSDDATLLTIANMSEGKIGYDITVNGFVTTQGNRTYSLISIPQAPHNINISKGLPVYMGSRAVSEVEYPTTDSDLTPTTGGKVLTNSLSIGRLKTLG